MPCCEECWCKANDSRVLLDSRELGGMLNGSSDTMLAEVETSEEFRPQFLIPMDNMMNEK